MSINTDTSFRSRSTHVTMAIEPLKKLPSDRLQSHVERWTETYPSNPDINSDLLHNSYCLKRPKKSLVKDAKELLSTVTGIIRSDSNRMLMMDLTINPGLEDALGPNGEIGVFFEHFFTCLKSQVPEECIVSFSVHLDEKSPHAHVMMVPVTKDKRLNTNDFLGVKHSPHCYYEFHTKIFDDLREKYPFLKRSRFEPEYGRKMVSVHILKESQALVGVENDIEECLNLVKENPEKNIPVLQNLLGDYTRICEDARSEVHSTKDHIVSLENQVKVLEYENQKLQWLIEEALTVIKRHNRKSEKDFHWRDPDLELLCERMNNTTPYQDEPTVTKELERS